MALKLTVISEQRGSLGRNGSILLGVGGGSIGRAHDNDWVLPDQHCYVSAHHARVQFRGGSYYLLDTSTNGVYVNGASTPINPRSIYPLRNGDYLRFGEYEVAVSIDVENPDAPEASSIFPIGANAHSAGGQQPDIGVEFDVEALLQPTAAGLSARPGSSAGVSAGTSAGTSAAASAGPAAGPPSGSPAGLSAGASAGRGSAAAALVSGGAAAQNGTGRFGPVDAFGQPISPEEAALAARARTVRPAAVASAATSAAAAAAAKLRRETRGAPLEPTGRHRALGAVAVEHAALEAFCRGAGLEARRLPAEGQARMLYLAGLLLREALAGLKGLALAQRELRDQARLSTGREDPQHIGLTGLPVEDLMLRLLLGHERHDLDAVQWLRDLAADSRAFELSLMRALPAALAEFIARLDPRSLAHQGSASDADMHSGSTGVTARFRSITESSPGALPQLFLEALARAFAAEFTRSPRDHARP